MKGKYNLTIPQNNIWLVENFYDDKSINILAGTFTVKTGFDIELAKKTVNKFFELNDAARLKFVKDGSTLYQYVEEYKPFDVITKDISGLSDEEAMKLKKEIISVEKNLTKDIPKENLKIFCSVMNKMSKNLCEKEKEKEEIK